MRVPDKFRVKVSFELFVNREIMSPFNEVYSLYDASETLEKVEDPHWSYCLPLEYGRSKKKFRRKLLELITGDPEDSHDSRILWEELRKLDPQIKLLDMPDV